MQISETMTALTPRQTAMQDAARKLEASFLSEMLKSAGLGAMEGPFGGGTGEEQFSSMMRDQQAQMMVEAGGIGLAEHLFKYMARMDHDQSGA